MAITATDIAQELGLSQSTVSRILNGDTRQRISAGTRERVLQAAARLEYQPNALARSLRHGRTDVLGLYTRSTYDARNDFLSEVLGGLQQACGRHGQDLMLQTGRSNKTTDEIFNAVRDGRIDGLVIHNEPEDPLVQRLAASSMPVVGIADPHPQLPCVTCDDAAGMQLIVEHLLNRGYRRFAFLEPSFSLASVVRRRMAWSQALEKSGVLEDDRILIEVDAEDAGAAFRDPGVYLQGPVAVSCWNDQTAYSLLRSCSERNISVPGQIAVTGFDGLLDTKLPQRQLVSVDCHWATVAERSIDVLMRLIAGETVPSETRIPVTLIEGDTT